MASLTSSPGPAPVSAASPEDCGDLRAVLRFPAHRSGVAAVRHKTREQLRRWGIPAGVCDDAVLIVSELATNAIVHTAGDTVTCHLGGGPEIYVEVDSNGRSAPRSAADPAAENAGRGLLVVEALSSMCGINVPAPGAGWTVWATLDLPTAEPGGFPAGTAADPLGFLVGLAADPTGLLTGPAADPDGFPTGPAADAGADPCADAGPYRPGGAR